MADMNFNSAGFQINTGSGQQNVKVTPKNLAAALENIAAPVFDFFTKSNNEETEEILDISKAIEHEELKLANTQRILGVDNHKINIVF